MMQYTQHAIVLPFGGVTVEPRDYQQITWDERTADDCRQLIRLAVREDLDRGHDLTTLALVRADARGTAYVVLRQPGVIAGLPMIDLLIQEMNLQVIWRSFASDGAELDRDTQLGEIHGSTRDLLTAERILLNMLGRLSGIATLTRKFVREVAGTSARIYDTRKTTPGWRRLEKYAVRCGGGRNHRTGLFDAVLIKDNHLAQAALRGTPGQSPAAAVALSREFLAQYYSEPQASSVLIEVEVDTVAQFEEALPANPDIILLDNMSLEQLRACVALRNTFQGTTQLEASGGITFENVRAIAETGVDRISLGALTHSAISLDVALDWQLQGA